MATHPLDPHYLVTLETYGSAQERNLVREIIRLIAENRELLRRLQERDGPTAGTIRE